MEIGKLQNSECLLNFIVVFKKISGVSLFYRGGGQKSSPYQKWLNWVMMAKNNQNVNESFVFIFTLYVVICKPKQYLQFLVKYLNNRCVFKIFNQIKDGRFKPEIYQYY